MESGTTTRAEIDAAHEELHPNGAGSRAEIEGEAGVAVGDMPPDPPRDESPPVEDLRVDGTTQLGLFKAGGKAATGASLRLTGGKIALVDGRAFKKGDVIHGAFTAVVNEVGQKDKHDPATQIVVDCEQRHGARITDLQLDS